MWALFATPQYRIKLGYGIAARWQNRGRNCKLADERVSHTSRRTRTAGEIQGFRLMLATVAPGLTTEALRFASLVPHSLSSRKVRAGRFSEGVPRTLLAT